MEQFYIIRIEKCNCVPLKLHKNDVIILPIRFVIRGIFSMITVLKCMWPAETK